MEAARLPHGTEDDARVRDVQQDDDDAHQHAVEDHELDFVVRDAAVEAFAQLRHAEGAADQDGDGADADCCEKKKECESVNLEGSPGKGGGVGSCLHQRKKRKRFERRISA